MTSVSVLDRELYSEAEAARLLGVAQSTLNYWLEGGVRRGRSYPPVIRAEAHGNRAPVTWAEVVDAGLLLREAFGVDVAEIDALNEGLGGATERELRGYLHDVQRYCTRDVSTSTG